MSVYDTGMYRAVEKAGGVAALAEALGVKRQACYPWLTRGWAPAKRAIQIEGLYGIPRADLMDPKLKSELAGTKNKTAQTGVVTYASRKARAVDDLV